MEDSSVSMDRKPPRGELEARFCQGLVNGNITSDNTTFDQVFDDVTATCPELLQWIQDNTPTEEPAVEPQAAPARKRRAFSGKRGGKKVPRPMESESVDDDDEEEEEEDSISGESKEKSVVEMLLGFCRAVERKQNDEVCKNILVVVCLFLSNT